MPIDINTTATNNPDVAFDFSSVDFSDARPATLDDVTDDCPLCQALRKKIESGNAPMVVATEGGIIELGN